MGLFYSKSQYTEIESDFSDNESEYSVESDTDFYELIYFDEPQHYLDLFTYKMQKGYIDFPYDHIKNYDVKIVFSNCILLQDLHPFKKDDVFQTIIIDYLNHQFIFTTKNERVAVNFTFKFLF